MVTITLVSKKGKMATFTSFFVHSTDVQQTCATYKPSAECYSTH